MKRYEGPKVIGKLGMVNLAIFITYTFLWLLAVVAMILIGMSTAHAAEYVEHFPKSEIEEVKCEVVGQEEKSVVGGAVGGAVGGVAGAVLGRWLFGDMGAAIGGLAGGATGATIGSGEAKLIYDCSYIINLPDGRIVWTPHYGTTSPYAKGDYTTVFRTAEGNFRVH